MLYKTIIKILNYGANKVTVNSGDRVRITNFLSITTAMLTLGYLTYYWFGLNSLFMTKVNGLFALAYLIPIVLNKFRLLTYAKLLFFILVIVHVTLLSIKTFTLAAGFHLYLILVIPGVYIVFDYKDTAYKTCLTLLALIAILLCEYIDNQTPIIVLSDESSRMMFQSSIVIIVLELLVINHLSTRDAEKREAMFQHLVDTDSLTGLFNRRYFNDAHNQHFRLALRYKRNYSLLLLDLDFFKKVNDHYGHQSGDLVLENLANLLKNNSRANDIVARIGGEEFAIILPETNKAEAFKVAESIRKKINEHEFNINEVQSIHITVSIGVQSWNDSIKSPTQLLKEVDLALYHAKETGRNKTIGYETLSMTMQ